MGNCLLKRSKKSGRSPSGVVPTPSVLRLHSPPSSPWTLWIRIALSYKPISVEFFPTAPFTPGQSTAVIELGSETLSGPHEKLLQYVDSRYPDPPLLSQPEKADQPALERAVGLQHCSINRHLERVAKWAVEMATRPERRSSVPSLENDPKMEVRKFERFYAQLHELLVEHAQVEERVIFPVLEKAERGVRYIG